MCVLSTQLCSACFPLILMPLIICIRNTFRCHSTLGLMNCVSEASLWGSKTSFFLRMRMRCDWAIDANSYGFIPVKNQVVLYLVLRFHSNLLIDKMSGKILIRSKHLKGFWIVFEMFYFKFNFKWLPSSFSISCWRFVEIFLDFIKKIHKLIHKLHIWLNWLY